MSNVFRSINASEYQQILDSVPLIAILIGAADDHFDRVERDWAKKIVHIRTFAHDMDLKPIYQDLEPEFEKRLNAFCKELPKASAERNKEISSRLSGLNVIFPKLNPRIASGIYEGLLDYAEQIAKASGGFMRMLSVSQEENEWIGLPMLDPVFFEDEEE